MLKKTLLSLSIASIALSASTAFAYEEGDIILRGGAAKVAPDASSGMIFIDQPALGNTGVDGVDVDSDTQLGLSLTYMMSDSIGVEVLGATPFKHDISLEALNTDIASTKHLPPTVTFNYHFAEPSSVFQPYVGIGLNYTTFFEEKVTPALDNAATFDLLASLTGGVPAGTITSVANTKIDLDDSFGVAIHAGFDYALTDSIGLNASYYWIDIDTTAEITTDSNVGQVKASVDVDIDPSVYMIGATYKF
jgi:outer membrane protein